MSNDILETLVELSMESGQDDEIGSVTESPYEWFAKFTFTSDDIEQFPCLKGLVGAILSCNSDGFYDYQGYKSHAKLEGDWEGVVHNTDLLTSDDE